MIEEHRLIGYRSSLNPNSKKVYKETNSNKHLKLKRSKPPLHMRNSLQYFKK